MKFACDVMLGRLARWLRLCGLDVFYKNDVDRSGLLRVAREEGRVVLTRAGNFRELSEIPPYFIISGDDLDGQILQVYNAYPGLDPLAKFLTRCVECNVPLEDVDKNNFRGLIPPKAMLIEGRFCRCPSCGKLLWPGTHVTRIRSRLERLFPSQRR
ncbi:MAG: Mut7-C RNAse domain-containing protein [bacterium]